MKSKTLSRLTEESKPNMPEGFSHIKRENLHLLLHSKKPAWLVVNGTGWEIVSSFNGKNSVKDIATHISQKYQIELSTALQDTVSYFSQLSEAGFFDVKKTVTEAPKNASPKVTRVHLKYHGKIQP